jgi:hypothetical protein
MESLHRWSALGEGTGAARDPHTPTKHEGRAAEDDHRVRDVSQLHGDQRAFLQKNLGPGEAVPVIVRGEFGAAIVGTERRAFVLDY